MKTNQGLASAGALAAASAAAFCVSAYWYQMKPPRALKGVGPGGAGWGVGESGRGAEEWTGGSRY